MVHKLIQWGLDNVLIVLLLAATLVAVGGFAFLNVNVEAYPDPAPAIIEVIAKYPGASAEEVERQVTIPLEVTLAGMPGLKYTRSKSLFGLWNILRNQFEYWLPYKEARQEVINRLQFVEGLPDGVQATLSPQSPTGEIMRYTLKSPKDDRQREIYTLNDLKAQQDWFLERQFRRVPRIIDIVSGGGTVKRYEIHPDPERLMRYGITLDKLQNAIQNSNANVGGDYLVEGENLLNVRGLGLIGGGLDPTRQAFVLSSKNPADVTEYLRSEEDARILRLRQIVVTSINNLPIRVEDLVEGGPLRYREDLGRKGVVVGNLPRLGRVAMSRPKLNKDGTEEIDEKTGQRKWINEPEKIQGIVLLRKGEASLPALHDLEEKIQDLNTSQGQLLPGVEVERYYDRKDLINITTETVHENLVLGMALVTVILLMFLSNIRSAMIVAINIPLALLFAFAVLYLRGKSANLLSIGAVDFGIIVDSSVIMVENIYRHLSAGEHLGLPLKERILLATREVEKSLFFTTAIMVCAFLPLFTMQGPEGQIFGPMADTYAFALGGALVLALVLAPALCLIFFKRLKPSEDNILVRWLKNGYLHNLERCLNHRWVTLGVMIGLLVMTMALLPLLGREFMPELEEGNLWIRGTFPINISLAEATEKADQARKIMQKYPEIRVVVCQTGRPDDGTDPTGFYNSEFFVPLKPRDDWPALKNTTGWKRLFEASRPRTKEELIDEMNKELTHDIVGVNWNFSQNIRDNVMESLSGVKGDNSVKIIGPDLDELEKLADQLKTTLEGIEGLKNVGIFRVKGQPNLEIPVDPRKCNIWGMNTEDVNDVVQTAIGGKSCSTMIEGEKRFDITLRWPEALRTSESSILNIPVDVKNNQLVSGVTSTQQTTTTGAATGLSEQGMSVAMPSFTGSQYGATYNNVAATPHRPLRDFVTPLGEDGQLDPAGLTELGRSHNPSSFRLSALVASGTLGFSKPLEIKKRSNGSFIRSGASTIYREQGNRLIAVKFSVRGRDLAGAVAEAQEKTKHLFQAPYTAEWSGEFQEMLEAEHRLMFIIPLSLSLIFILLYLAFHSFLDALLVFSNVAALSMGGVWALLLVGINFSISAAVGFISIFGVAIMDGLLMISYFNQLRAQGLLLREAIMKGAEKRVRPVMMTALTAIFGLLPAAVSTKIGAQTQQPLAIVVVGGMISTLLLTRYLMPVLYSFYGHREPNEYASQMAH